MNKMDAAGQAKAIEQKEAKNKIKTKRPSHSAGANFLWSLKMLLKYSPAAFALMVLSIFINLALQYFQIYLPALVVSEVTEARPLLHALVAVGAVMLAMLLCNILKKALGFVRLPRLST